MRKALRVTATTAVGMTLLSCTAPPPPVVYTPPPPVAYAPRPPVVYAPPPLAPYGKSTYGRSETPPQPTAHMVWRTSKRWAAVKTGARTSAVEQDSQAKFKAAQAKAAKVGVENLTKDDIDGLNVAQLKELRGY
jgi:hypothetical protein